MIQSPKTIKLPLNQNTRTQELNSYDPIMNQLKLEKADYWILALLAACYIPFLFLGYGCDNDTYGVLDTGRIFLADQRYVPSRNPGYLPFEMTIMVLNQLGGSVACNTGTLLCSLIVAGCFLAISRAAAIPGHHLLAVVMGLQPTYWIASTTSMDYLWALALTMIALILVLRRWIILAGILLGLAMGFRLASFIGAGVIFGYAVFTRPCPSAAKLLTGLIAGAAIAAACYIPAFLYAHHTLAFLKPGLGDPSLWTLKLTAGRFVYKNIYLFGLAGSAVVWGLLLWHIPAVVRETRNSRAGLVWVSLAFIIGYEALFGRYPVEPSYLLPALPFLFLLTGMVVRNRTALLTLAATVLIHNIVTLNIAKPDVPNAATNARFGLWVEPGEIVKNVRERYRYRDCLTLNDWGRVTQELGIHVPAGGPTPKAPPR